MNLAMNPTRGELAALIRRCDDKAYSHILWVAKDGEVHLDPRLEGITPGRFRSLNKHLLKFSNETFCRGNNYVGPDAAKDKAHVDRLFTDLQRLWRTDFVGHSNY
jgi:hypothetical protein